MKNGGRIEKMGGIRATYLIDFQCFTKFQANPVPDLSDFNICGLVLYTKTQLLCVSKLFAIHNETCVYHIRAHAPAAPETIETNFK